MTCSQHSPVRCKNVETGDEVWWSLIPKVSECFFMNCNIWRAFLTDNVLLFLMLFLGINKTGLTYTPVGVSWTLAPQLILHFLFSQRASEFLRQAQFKRRTNKLEPRAESENGSSYTSLLGQKIWKIAWGSQKMWDFQLEGLMRGI